MGSRLRVTGPLAGFAAGFTAECWSGRGIGRGRRPRSLS